VRLLSWKSLTPRVDDGRNLRIMWSNLGFKWP
jgi:hypothetical protein